MGSPPVQGQELQVDLRRYELRHGTRVLKLEKIPMELVIFLSERKGELVTREEIAERLWGKGVFLDTEQGINTAVRKVRQALQEDPERPQFIQTIVGKGYRLVGPVTVIAPGSPQRSGSGGDHQRANFKVPAKKVVWGALATLFAALALSVVLYTFGHLKRKQQSRAAPAIRAIAVLPLDNLSGDSSQDYFADGMTDEIITNLAKISSVRVISKTSIMRYKNAHRALPEIAQALNVDAVVEGSVVRAGNRVRVTAQLIDAPSDRHLWANEYQQNVTDILTLQSELAREIAAEIKATLTPDERLRLTSKGSVNPLAYEAYLKGRSYWNQRTEAGLANAIEQFTTAASLDTKYAEAYSGLADSYTALGYLSYLDPNDAFPRARAAAVKALQLDPTLAEAHASLAYYELYYDWNWPEAEREFKLALSLNPNYATGYEWYSIYLLAMGRFDESLTAISRAQQLDPLSVAIKTDVGFQYYYRRDYDRAIQELRGAVATNSRFPLAHLWLGRAYQQKGMYAEAIQEFAQTEAALPGWVVTIAGVGNAYGEWGKRAEAERILKTLTSVPSGKFVTPYGVALVYAGMGKKDEAFKWLDKAVEGRAHWLVWLNLDPRWSGLRSDRRFVQLVDRVGLAHRE